MAITRDGIQQVEEEAVDAYCSEIYKREFKGETIEGELPEQVDVDAYRNVPATCYISGKQIMYWLHDDFWDTIDAFLKSKGCKTISEYISKDYALGKLSVNEYYDCVIDVCRDAEYYWEDEIYPELVEDYFYENAEYNYN